jgi:hypothetical protein
MFSNPAAVYPWLKHEVTRYQTFFTNTYRPWSYTGGDPIRLAAAGFYYYGHRDFVQCVFCGVILGEWETGENPMDVHKFCYPHCPFIKGHNVGNIRYDHFAQCEISPGN